MTIIVDVTQDDIDKGHSHSASCPIALACKRLHFKEVRVFKNSITLDGLTYATPDIAKAFITKFDNNDTMESEVKPFSFDLIVHF